MTDWSVQSVIFMSKTTQRLPENEVTSQRITVINLTKVNLYQGKSPIGVNLNQEMTYSPYIPLMFPLYKSP